MTDEPERRPRRSALYMPGANARALEKAAGLPADVVILDLEDAVSPDAKSTAREQVCAAVADGRYGPREVVVRANAVDSVWFDEDLEAIAAAGPDAVLVPKVATPRTVHHVEDALRRHGAPARTCVWAMLETPTAVLDARAIVGSSPRLTGFVVGTNDLVKDLGAQHVPGRVPLLSALSWLVLAVREAGKVIIDGVFSDLDDADGFEAECRQGRAFGFDGKTVIHPRQLEPCNRLFGPDEHEVASARRLIEGFEAARADGRGVANVDGRMVEQLHADEARRILAMADRIAELDDSVERGT